MLSHQAHAVQTGEHTPFLLLHLEMIESITTFHGARDVDRFPTSHQSSSQESAHSVSTTLHHSLHSLVVKMALLVYHETMTTAIEAHP
jgi:hypothetical protein